MMFRFWHRKLVVSGPFIEIRNLCGRRFGKLMYVGNKVSFMPIEFVAS